jgi:hypothetical protein
MCSALSIANLTNMAIPCLTAKVTITPPITWSPFILSTLRTASTTMTSVFIRPPAITPWTPLSRNECKERCGLDYFDGHKARFIMS